MLAGRLKLKKFARERAGYYEALIVSRPHNMHRAASILRRRFPNAPLIYDAEALYFVREELRAVVLGTKPNPVAKR